MNSVERDREAGRSIFEHITAATVRERWLKTNEGGMQQVKVRMQRDAVFTTINELEGEGVLDPRLAEVLQWLAKGRTW